MAEQAEVETGDRELFEKVARMNNPAWPESVQLHYTQTLDAMNRMRVANSRKRLISIRSGTVASQTPFSPEH
jgi:hypothetical protein